MKDFFAMSGYAVYVWSSYAISLAVLLLNVLWSRAALRRAVAEARRRIASGSES